MRLVAILVALSGCSLIVSDDPSSGHDNDAGIDAGPFVVQNLCEGGVRNGVPEGDEECDPSAEVDNSSACTENCQFNRCGDGFVRDYIESCDNGSASCQACIKCDTEAGEVRAADGTCYLQGGSQAAWHQALASCLADDGDLAIFDPSLTKELFDELGIQDPDNDDTWIGLYRLATGGWRWLDGASLDATIVDVDDCGACRGFLSVNGGSAELEFRGDQGTIMGDDFFCMRHDLTRGIVGEARGRHDEGSNHYYSLERRPAKGGSNVFTWQEARTDCVRRKAELTSITSQAELNLIAGILRGEDSVRVGLQYSGLNLQWEWLDGTPLDTSVLNWQNGNEPIDPSAIGCGEITPNLELIGVACDPTGVEQSNHFYICEWD